MKKIKFILSLFVMLSIISCNIDDVNEQLQQHDPNFRVAEAINKTNGKSSVNSTSRSSADEPCMTTNLIAGQHHIAGTVSVDMDEQDIIIIYTTNDDWSIKATHMSIGNCDDQSIPTTGSGNPKVGKFEHHSNHSEGVNQVVYRINKDILQEQYCFAAHAEVTGSTGNETAWAEGPEFPGKSWAMYVEGLLSDCDIDDDENPDPR